MTSRRAARRRGAPTSSSRTKGIPDDLAAGPCIEIWARDGEMPTWSARRHWSEARERWAARQGLELPGDYRHLPRELRDRAPYYRESIKEIHP